MRLKEGSKRSRQDRHRRGRGDLVRVTAFGVTAAKTWTAEPTVLTVLRAFQLDPNKGLFSYDYPLGQTPDSAVAEGFALVFTAPAAVNVFAGMRFERA